MKCNAVRGAGSQPGSAAEARARRVCVQGPDVRPSDRPRQRRDDGGRHGGRDACRRVCQFLEHRFDVVLRAGRRNVIVQYDFSANSATDVVNMYQLTETESGYRSTLTANGAR